MHAPCNIDRHAPASRGRPAARTCTTTPAFASAVRQPGAAAQSAASGCAGVRGVRRLGRMFHQIRGAALPHNCLLLRPLYSCCLERQLSAGY
jgi:hypothetical protein